MSTQPRLFPTRKVGRRGQEVALDPRERLDGELDATLAESHPGFPSPTREYLFALQVGRRWSFDFAWVPFKVALEWEGGAWGRFITDTEGQRHRVVKSRHTDPQGFAEDCRKYNTAAVLGWLVLRTNEQLVRDRSIYDQVIAALKLRGWKEGIA